MRRIDELIWHCAATPEGKNFTVEDIDSWHKQRGWSGIGYHKVVYLDGSVHDGRSESRVGAHVGGRNTGTIGYCYIGGVDATDARKAKDTRTPEQKETMLRITKEAVEKYNLKKVSGHRDYAAKACPCFDARAEYSHLVGDADPHPKSKRPVLRKGSSGGAVKGLQSRLNELGSKLLVDGDFGAKTKAEVKDFQRHAGITADGIVGPQTYAALDAANKTGD